MKKTFVLALLFALLLTGCVPQATPAVGSGTSTTGSSSAPSSPPNIPSSKPTEGTPEFEGLDDKELLGYVEDTVYTELLTALDSTEYFVENISSVYVSKEYLEELAFNSQENIYFGFTLSEIDELFEGTRYIFTLDKNGETTAKEFTAYDDTYDRILENVLVGSGVILLCVTVSAVSRVAGAQAFSMIFAASAKTGSLMAASSALFGGLSAGIIKGIESHDMNAALKEAALTGSESFKWGAISGAISGTITEGTKYAQAMKALKGVNLNGLTTQQAAAIQMESGFPIDVIKNLQSMEQYEILKKANLSPTMVNNKLALTRQIDLDYTDADGLTNLQRMSLGKAPLDSSGKAYELHHVGQKNDSTLAILTQEEHRLGNNHQIWHPASNSTENPSSQANWTNIREKFWKSIASFFEKAA